MKNASFFTLLLGLCLLMVTSCKTDFEKIRSSGDVEMLHKKAFEYFEAEEYLKAQTLFELIIGSYRGKKEQEGIYYSYAYTHYHLGKYILASYYFKNFANTFTNSQYREEADFMAAYASYKLSPSYRLDQTYSQKAIESFQLFVNTYPTSERIGECNKLIDELRVKLEKKAYSQAELYFNLKQYQSADHAFENLLREYPESANAEKVRYMITKASYLLADNSIDQKQEERFETTVENYQDFVKRYPNSEYKKELDNIYKNSSKKIKAIANGY